MDTASRTQSYKDQSTSFSPRRMTWRDEAMLSLTVERASKGAGGWSGAQGESYGGDQELLKEGRAPSDVELGERSVEKQKGLRTAHRSRVLERRASGGTLSARSLAVARRNTPCSSTCSAEKPGESEGPPPSSPRSPTPRRRQWLRTPAAEQKPARKSSLRTGELDSLVCPVPRACEALVRRASFGPASSVRRS